MNKPFIAALVVGLAACGQEAPKPAAQKPTPPPAAAPSAPPPPAAAEAPKPDPNKELARRVKQALESEKKIQGGGIDVTAADGVVTLWGTTGTPAERSTAVAVASKVQGVKSVQNNLKVVKGS